MFKQDVKEFDSLLDIIFDDDNHHQISSCSVFENSDEYFFKRLADKSIKRLLKDKNFQRYSRFEVDEAH